MLHYDNNVEQCGFYQVGQQRYYSKLQAIMAAENCNDFPHFIFHDEEYSQHNWLQEPSESLEQLYARRAWELRNQYDYLVLHYSSGQDSNAVLDTFIRNKIPLDEIFIRGLISPTDKNINNNDASNMFAESYFNAYPIAQHVKDTYYPNLKITVVDTTEYVVDFFKSNPNWCTVDTFTNTDVGVAHKSDYDALNPAYRKMSEAGLRVGHILGIDKPVMIYENGEYHIKFLDKLLNIFFPTRNTTIDVPLYSEPFFWAKSTAPLIIKQAHAVKNYFKSNNLDPNILHRAKDRRMHDMIGNVIYPPRLMPILFNPEKQFDPSVVRPWERFFFKDPNADHVKNWNAGIASVDRIIPEKWKNKGSLFSDLVGIYSRSYSVGS